MNSYQSKNPVLSRSGSAPRTICYTLPTSQRNFEYQKPKITQVELRGNMIKRINVPEAKEENVFRKVAKRDEPNTLRTLVPELAPQPEDKSFVRSKSVKHFGYNPNIRPGNINSLLDRTEREDNMRARKATNPKVYQSFSFSEDTSNNQPHKRLTKEGEYKKYDNTTQIVSLPGGVKRSDKDIRDDGIRPLTRNNTSFSAKLARDYNSNITCLPGTMVKNYTVERPVGGSRKNQSSDIFNINPLKENYNSFKVSNKKVENTNRIFGQSNEEKRLVPHPKGKPNQIRNVFASQITFA